MQVNFYHLTRTPVERALPRLLEKILQRQERALVLVAPEKLSILDDALWTYRPDGFLPHGTASTGRAEDQPLWLTENEVELHQNPNQSKYVVLTGGRKFPSHLSFESCFYMFDGHLQDELEEGRNAWRRLREEGGHLLIYWKQDSQGNWVREEL